MDDRNARRARVRACAAFHAVEHEAALEVVPALRPREAREARGVEEVAARLQALPAAQARVLGGVIDDRLVEREQRLAAMLRKGGIPALDRRIAALLIALSDSGIADGIGVLVGTLAYTSYSGMLGVVLEKATLATNDIDIVRDTSAEIEVAGDIDILNLLSKPDHRFRTIPGLDPKSLPSSLISPEGSIRIAHR